MNRNQRLRDEKLALKNEQKKTLVFDKEKKDRKHLTVFFS
jgi:hypothetical protein